MVKLLLAESHKEFALLVMDAFARESYEVELEDDGCRMNEQLCRKQYDMIVLQIALPGCDGIRIVRNYRSRGGIAPIILVDESHHSRNMERALDAGGDVYLVKPLEVSDLAAQVRALMRRPTMHSDRVLRWGEVALDIESGFVTRDGEPIHLRPMEFRLLQFLLSHIDHVFTTEALGQRVWHKDFELDTVRTHIKTLRQKIDVQGRQSIITTVRGLGYKTEKRSGSVGTPSAWFQPLARVG